MTRIEKLKELNNTDVNDLLALVETMLDALIEFDMLIKHDYTGSREAMTDLTYAAQAGAKALAAYDEFNEVRE